MSQTQPAPELDLSNCDREPIAFPGAVQPHVALLVIDASVDAIVQASANTSDLLGLDHVELIGRTLTALLADLDAGVIADSLASQKIGESPFHLGDLTVAAQRFDVFAHRVDELLLIEFESVATAPLDTPSERRLYGAVRAASAELQATNSVREFLATAVARIRDLTGFDQILAYRFAPDGSGEVIAEAVDDTREKYLGLHYPASDIPDPARRLFALSWLRILPDVDYCAVPIVPGIAAGRRQPLDLSRALSRSVSMMYTGYLRNMGVRASMVMPLYREGALWGLISCLHHQAPRFVPYDRRIACEFLAHSVSLMLAEKEKAEYAEYSLRMSRVRDQLIGRITAEGRIAEALTCGSPGLLDLIDADGAAVCFGDEVQTVGRTPEPTEIRRLVDQMAALPDEDLVTDHLVGRLPWAASLVQTASGVIFLRLARDRSDAVVFFRGVVLQTVTWHGDPNKPVEIVGDPTIGARLLPRTSFALWQQTVSDRSRPWLACEAEGARDLRRAVVEQILRHLEQMRRLNAELTRSNVELDSFAYIASHDLKEPLRGIANFATLLARDQASTLVPSAREHVDMILRLTRRMDDLIESLLRYSRLGRAELDLELVDLNEALSQALESLTVRIAESGGVISVPAPLGSVLGDQVRIVEVFVNLISNALKYSDRAVRLVEITSTPGPPTVIHVRDDGIGIAPRLYERIFHIFRRLHEREQYGGGTGVGLTITRRVIERHGGRIWVQSEPGLGTTFSFTLAPEIQS